MFTSTFFLLCFPSSPNPGLMRPAPAAVTRALSPTRSSPSRSARPSVAEVRPSSTMATSNGATGGSNNPLSTPPPPVRTASALLSPSALARVRMASIQQQQSSTPPSATFATDDIRITAPNVEFAPQSLRKDCVLFYYPVRRLNS